jgi:translation initiation factor IF-2
MAKAEAKSAPVGVKAGDLAKEFGVPTKIIVERAKALNIEVKNASTVLKPGQADRLRAKLGHADHLREELSKKTHILPKAKDGAKKAGKKAAEPDETIAETEDAPGTETIEASAAAAAIPIEQTAPAEETVAEMPTEALVEPPPVEEPLPAAEAPPPAVEVATLPIVEPPPPADLPVETRPTPPPRFIQAGPDLAPVLQKEPEGRADTRFGVVITADTARELHGDVEPRRKVPRTVESKAVEEFKAEVTYPKFAEMKTAAQTEETMGRGAVRGGIPVRRRGPVQGARKGMQSQGPRHGRALLQENDRYRGARRSKASRSVQPVQVPRTGPAEVTSPVTIKNLCESLGIKAKVMIEKFFKESKVVTINSILTNEDAELYAQEFDPLKFGIKIKKARDVEEDMLKQVRLPDKAEDLQPRAPVVTVMGHVDHGKTSLLDYIRKAHVAAGEAGGITQHIRAHMVRRPNGNIVFLDTPGHRAFTEMRARGANVTDMVVLVVAANDGVMPQTEEAISHAKLAAKTTIVALNKIDLPDANIDRVKAQLAAKQIFVEGYGGDTGCVEVSAKTGQGIEALLDRILLESEVAQIKANPNKPALGTVIEAHKDQGRGIVATILIQEGTLRSGDCIVCGHAYGSVRQLLDDRGESIESAGPSTPVLVTGLSEVPLSGERFYVLSNIKEAAEIAEKRAMLMRQESMVSRKAITLETLHSMLQEGAVAALRLIMKVDVMGSLVPLENAVREIATDEARVEIVHSGVGSINETDVELAGASQAILIGFNVTADPGARRLAEERMVQIRSYDVIYDVVDDVRKALEGLLKPFDKEVIQGHLTVRQTFKISKVGTVAGCYVNDGLITRHSSVRLVRDGKPVWSGKLDTLKRLKDDAREVRAGFECGLKLAGYDDIKTEDTLEVFTVEQIARTLEGATRA